MYATIEKFVPEKISEADLEPRGKVYPSPSTWRDQVLYFLLPDRFSDGLESRKPMFDRGNPRARVAVDKRAWMESGKRFQGGTIKGIKDKLLYLEDLGVTTLWIGPVWRQRKDQETYHGYGIQNFMEVDPRFGTRKDLRDLVSAAHSKGMYVLLDIIYNHTGNNWYYELDGDKADWLPYRIGSPYPFHGWRSGDGNSTKSIETHDDGVWPKDFQNVEWYTRAGQMANWELEPWETSFFPLNELQRGDFFGLKELNLERADTLSAVTKVYQYWIALTDCDGFRIDSVKRIPKEASRRFYSSIHEYAESIGKENFLLLGEISCAEDTSKEHDYTNTFNRYIDSAIDVGEPAENLTNMVKGLSDPRTFFQQFKEYYDLESHREFGRFHVTILDDPDMIGRFRKRRFAANVSSLNRYQQVAHAVGVQLTTLGIPCIYYGTEQALDGTEERHDSNVEPRPEDQYDRYIRECMFGGTFGAFETENCHFFDKNHHSH